jgi:hypothetical protein
MTRDEAIQKAEYQLSQAARWAEAIQHSGERSQAHARVARGYLDLVRDLRPSGRDRLGKALDN